MKFTHSTTDFTEPVFVSVEIQRFKSTDTTTQLPEQKLQRLDPVTEPNVITTPTTIATLDVTQPVRIPHPTQQ